MARKKHDEHAAPEIRNDVDCRAAKPKFKNGVWMPAKISDTTGGGLYLLVKPDPDKPGAAASKLWQMAYRFHGRQKTYSIGAYGNDKDGGISLATARQKRDIAKGLLAQDPPVDPSIEKQFERHRQAAERPFGEDVDGWLAEKKTEKIKRGKLVVVRSAETNTLHELMGRLFEGSFRQALSERHQASRRAGLFPVNANRRQIGNP